MVTPRFGPDIVGGAENLVRALALRGRGPDLEIEVASTCADDQHSWENRLPPGETREDGLRVRRFPVGARDAERHLRLHARLMSRGRLSYLEEIELMASSVWSPDLQGVLEREGRSYDLIVFAPYLLGTTYWGLQAWPERSAVIPCLHDEPYAHLVSMRAVIEACAGCIFNAPAEERLARRLFRVRAGGVVGMGFDPPGPPPPPPPSARGLPEHHGLGRYLLYAGRLEEGKRVHEAVEYVARLRAEREPATRDLRLVLIGRGGYRAPREHRDAVVPLGYVGVQDKRALHAHALALVNPSALESLSLVLMESWLEGTPALVAAGSEVMREHVERSGGGIAFADYAGFAAGVRRLSARPEEARRMGAAGREYVLDAYGWPAVRERLRGVIAELLR